MSLAGEMAYGLSTFFSVSSLLPLFDTERKNLIMSPTAFTWEPSLENLAQHEVLLAFFKVKFSHKKANLNGSPQLAILCPQLLE